MVKRNEFSSALIIRLFDKITIRGIFLTFFGIGAGACAFIIYQNMQGVNCNNRPLIGSYYYPWYTIERWKWGQDVMGKPLLGPYNNSDQKVINKHIDWAQDAGIDYFIYSWLGTNKKEHGPESKITDNFIRQTSKVNYKIMPLYETPLALNQSPDNIDFDQKYWPRVNAGDQFIKDMLAFSNQAHNSEHFLRINNCPRVAIYLARNMLNQDKYFNKLKKALANRNQCLDFTADVSFWNSSDKPLARSNQSSEHQWAWLANNFSAVFGYNMYSHDINVYEIQGDLAFDKIFLKAKSVNQKKWEKRSHDVGLKYHYSIQPGYDDRPLRGNERPAAPSSEKFLLKDWERIYASLSKDDHILITSFNEWYEGTAIEPTKKDGTSLIAANRKAADAIKRKFCN
ncbi:MULTISPECIES: glycoside hydrolase family 99-like domain-containing protein [unclassified Prochlorococcus]|uniref:glycoside hydrolase family 99-like domain-containing protein n=1 Tax=unclassified Prochlorococcus TaxID=2627481 RepID=UPI000533A62F|nr:MULTISPECIES: glycoside hydrolase family 99-like domain-containing protein [unclassified Prochlorococcus]KGG26700.1 hypothetical protein EV12_1790 [Prochlorococcus sp. MIT 0701]KGG30256.1 hypothetical protein EV13_0588 [Prochlorococcus sp. MIT 0702]KGG34925.1 hypothetical protein EV14_0969 [Prochlorococcus sp. MIT 0703]